MVNITRADKSGAKVTAVQTLRVGRGSQEYRASVLECGGPPPLFGPRRILFATTLELPVRQNHDGRPARLHFQPVLHWEIVRRRMRNSWIDLRPIFLLIRRLHTFAVLGLKKLKMPAARQTTALATAIRVSEPQINASQSNEWPTPGFTYSGRNLDTSQMDNA